MVAQALPNLTSRSALFLDFDGTLVELAERPGDVVVPPGLTDELAAMSERLGGALAVISGRTIAQIDAQLSPLKLPVTGVHGVQRRNASGHTIHIEAPPLEAAAAELRLFADAHPGTLVEVKRGALALHYRLAPELEALCLSTMQQLCAGIPGTALMSGKMVVELKPARANKGHAVNAYLHEPPFHGRTPVYVGDDVTDEDAFIAVQARGGIGVKVGTGPSAAKCRLTGPAALRSWLQAQLSGLEGEGGEDRHGAHANAASAAPAANAANND